MKMHKFYVLGILIIVLALGLVLGECATTDDEPYAGPKSIKITGFNWENTGGIFVFIFNEPSAWSTPLVAGGRTDQIGSNINVELKDGKDQSDGEPWTGTGKYYIWIQVAPVVSTSAGQRRVYLYTTDGVTQVSVDDDNPYDDTYSMDGITNAASIDIKDAITTLDFAKFVYRGKDPTAG
jgi:hypothetical protein